MAEGPCRDLDAFADGLLDEPRAAGFREHLGECLACARRLEVLAVLDGLADELAERGLDESALIARQPQAAEPWWTGRAGFLLVAVFSAAAAALLTLALGRAQHPAPREVAPVVAPAALRTVAPPR